ncbi:MAG: pyridoxal phosphate-dependent aminotransferase [Pseudomonadota bacterium]|nr:pyridoxal phosphate-dependent aminotransferase [Pseudomonadota bacterium]
MKTPTQILSSQVNAGLTSSAGIRKLFEQGIALKHRYGAEHVYDFSLGNPYFAPPQFVQHALQELIANPSDDMHLYMPNAGHLSTRQAVASHLATRDNLPVEAKHIVMSIGAAGGLNVALKTIINPDDEVVIIAPYFIEYLNFIKNYQGIAKISKSNDDFNLNLDALEQAITPRTKALLLNSPNNPTGAVYDDLTLRKVGELLRRKQQEFGTTIFLIADDIYQHIVYDGAIVTPVSKFYDNSLIITSFSKDLALAGERIGYIYVSPACVDNQRIVEGLVFATRALGYVNAPSLFQLLIAKVIGLPIDIKLLATNRTNLAQILTQAGVDVRLPHGAFYFFLPVPTNSAVAKNNDAEFCRFLQEEFRILAVPGSLFGCSGYFRLSYSVPTAVISRSEDVWCKAIQAWHAQGCAT